jgi:hypothetical protein
MGDKEKKKFNNIDTSCFECPGFSGRVPSLKQNDNLKQGILTEGEGSVQLTSLEELV